MPRLWQGPCHELAGACSVTAPGGVQQVVDIRPQLRRVHSRQAPPSLQQPPGRLGSSSRFRSDQTGECASSDVS